jgi:hypothetical protein
VSDDTQVFDKIKAILVAFALAVLLAALAAALKFTETVDWSGLGVFGPAVGLAAGTGVAALIGYVKKEFTGYGTKQNPQIPNGEGV